MSGLVNQHFVEYTCTSPSGVAKNLSWGGGQNFKIVHDNHQLY